MSSQGYTFFILRLYWSILNIVHAHSTLLSMSIHWQFGSLYYFKTHVGMYIHSTVGMTIPLGSLHSWLITHRVCRLQGCWRLITSPSRTARACRQYLIRTALLMYSQPSQGVYTGIQSYIQYIQPPFTSVAFIASSEFRCFWSKSLQTGLADIN